jgi:hypothetical protein
MFQIELSDHVSYESFTREVVLDEITFKLKFRYNASKDFWTVEIQDTNTNPIRIYKCICNFDIMMRDTNTTLPKGKLFFYTEDKTKSATQKEDFKTKKVSLVYITQTEWNLLKN